MVSKVSAHLRHKDWDARVAAAHCLGLLAEHFAHPGVPHLLRAAGAGPSEPPAVAVKQEAGDVKAEPGEAGAGEEGRHMLRFESFQIGQVLEQGTPLLASWGVVSARSGRSQLLCMLASARASTRAQWLASVRALQGSCQHGQRLGESRRMG